MGCSSTIIGGKFGLFFQKQTRISLHLRGFRALTQHTHTNSSDEDSGEFVATLDLHPQPEEVLAQEAQALFARARLRIPYNEGRKKTLKPK
jgi:hypothetical protein